MIRKGIYEAIDLERTRQADKFGSDYSLTSDRWVRLIVEELGEVASEVDWLCSVGDPCAADAIAVQPLRAELIQVAALAVAWLEQLPSEEG